jgi:hypothetical protein
MSLGLKIYAVAGVAVLVLCFALVAAMVIDAQSQRNGAGGVLSSVDSSVHRE